jgi:predicted site-specific integrase-resolvase
MQNEIDTIYITYKDRFVRFGYEWFERLCKMHDTKIVVLNNVETSPTQEMIDDMVSIEHVFSGRLSGLRKYQTKIQNDKSLKGDEKDDPNAKGQAVSEQNDAKGD